MKIWPVSYTHLDVYKRQDMAFDGAHQGVDLVEVVLVVEIQTGVDHRFERTDAAHHRQRNPCVLTDAQEVRHLDAADRGRKQLFCTVGFVRNGIREDRAVEIGLDLRVNFLQLVVFGGGGVAFSCLLYTSRCV